ncbi:MAG TPA: aspartyl protease family protein [Pyrinomonadaceae bacterium]|nr:aspartyl protease family protein [Pyrinomonadaceae bacterium]
MKKLSRVVWGSLAAFVLCVMLGGDAWAAAVVMGKGDKNREKAARALREGEFEVAEKIYRGLVEKDQKDIPARLGLSFALLKQRNLRDAYDHAARVLALDPTSARAHALLGSTLLAAGDFRLSIEEFRTALTFKEDEALAIAGLSMINFYENRAQIALAGLRRAVYLDPNEPDYVFSYAQAAARSERYREAADAYEDFLRIAPRTDADRRARIRGLISFLRYLGSQRQLYITGGSSRAAIPFELVNSRPIINVRINGSKTPLRFVVDTGSGMCVLSTQTAERMNIKPVAQGGLARAVGGGGRFEIVYGFLTSLQMDDVRIENVPVYIRQFHNQQETVDGYIGLSVLAKYVASFDYAGQQMTLVRQSDRTAPLPPRTFTDTIVPFNSNHVAADPNAPPSNAALAATPSAVRAATAALPAPSKADATASVKPDAQSGAKRIYEIPIRSTSSGFWSSSVVLEGVEKPLNFIVDTGASISVVSEELARSADMSRFEQKTRLKVFGAAGVTEDVITLLLPRVSLGDYTHANLPAAVLDMSAINETSGFEQTGIIGGNILRRFRVTFDFQRGLVRLEPPTTTTPSAPAAPQTRDANITPASGATP